ncbi:uncharacterized protein LOC131650261 [Vicia villosa]|uniref:uncharacterized protein LOC131650261 n=1 Tax=Vicia villosa TaxID=3911 RepID=UPI00273BC9F1|nr:uncharacterized protein LOC131650261 [Vicia villosa]
MKSVKLWIRWIGAYYLKGGSIMQWEPKTTSSWMLKNIAKVRGLTVQSEYWSDSLSNVIFPRVQSCRDTKSVILDICANEDRKIAGRVAVMLEGLWKNRNDFVWHNEKEEASKLGWLAFHKWQEWFTAQNPRDIQGVSGNLVNWSPPPFGWLKCNVDAAFNQRLGTTNRGWCISNDQGNFVAAGTAWDECTFSVLEAEALALKEAIQVASTLYHVPVIFESDSQQVVNAIGSNLGDRFCSGYGGYCSSSSSNYKIYVYLLDR